MVAPDTSATDRLQQIESSLAISQLPSRYAMALDARDLDALVALFVDDVAAGAHGSGRDALKRWYDAALRRFYRSIHLVCGHHYEFVDCDHATGSVYCRAEHEDGDGWYVITMRYDDVYERRHGQWFFVKRRGTPLVLRRRDRPAGAGLHPLAHRCSTASRDAAPHADLADVLGARGSRPAPAALPTAVVGLQCRAKVRFS
jgi:ketosteroid isomerase-like protein